jgi:hypothetical protein
MMVVVVVMTMMMIFESIMNLWWHENSEVLEDCCVLRSDTAHCGISFPVFQKKLLPVSSW